ncbi:LuxR C-terminal-related transcriptional regulator [Streptomyces sp. NPDC056431]|uniref:LuxR C-terminal-related transcriptional regulator n=1 Tax=Streptomyces sp. NPDC056431 TaxID=3345814 RepID=UPI0036A498AF
MLETLGLSVEADSIYRVMLEQPQSGVAELAVATLLTENQVRAALDELGRLMLVRVSRDHPGDLCVVSPQIGLTNILRQQEAELARRQADLAASRAVVTELFAAHADGAQTHGAHGERLLGLDAIQSRLEIMGRTMTGECMGVHPGRAQRAEDLLASRQPNAEALARGVTFRTLYQDCVRNDAATVEHANWLLKHGGEVRTAPVVPQRMVITDRSHALVPLDPADSRKGALYITEPGIALSLVTLFEQSWSLAEPLGACTRRDPETGLNPVERQLLRLLASGLTDEAAGQRLGISVRTVRRQMASIMERLGATSRFEAGLKAAQRSWL